MRRAVLAPLVPALAALALLAGGCGDETQGGPSTTPEPAGAVVRVDGRATTIDLDRETFGVLEDNEVGVGAVKPASARGTVARFPITGGAVASNSLAGKVDHAGSIVFSRGDRHVVLEDLVLDLRSGLFTASLDGRRLAVARLLLERARRVEEGGKLVLNGLPLLLTAQAASTLNRDLDVPIFEPLLPLGEATVRLTTA